MNKNTLAVAFTGLALVSFGQLASAHEEDEDTSPPVYQQNNDPRYDARQQFDRGGGRLRYEVDHLNRMLAHVQGELRRYRADRRIWGQYEHIRDEARRLNNQFRRGEQFYNRGQVRAQIEHMHDELHQIEQDLHVPSNAWYRWR